MTQKLGDFVPMWAGESGGIAVERVLMACETTCREVAASASGGRG